MAQEFQQLINDKQWEKALVFLNDPKNNHLFTDQQFKENNGRLLHILGVEHQKSGRLDVALRTFDAVLKILPDNLEAYLEIANTFRLNCEFEASEKILLHALSIHPANASLLNDLGITYQNLAQYDKALACYHKSIEQRPGYPITYFNLGILNLILGNYPDGFANYEARFLTDKFVMADQHFIDFLWHGEDLSGKHLFVVGEQGFGDSILFFRFLKALHAQAGKLTLCAKPALKKLFESQGVSDTVITPTETFPEYDYHIPMMSLGHALKLTRESVPGQPYITSDASLKEKWQSKLDTTGKRRIGVAWGGSSEFIMGKIRNCPDEAFAKIIQDSDDAFYCLQPNSASSRLHAEKNFHDFSDEFTDFAETAALIDCLDLVITVDTAVAHLAGALGKPVWILLYIPPAWQWGISGEDSIWYPTARLFRQPSAGDWEGAIENIQAALNSPT